MISSVAGTRYFNNSSVQALSYGRLRKQPDVFILVGICTTFFLRMSSVLLQNAEVCGKPGGQKTKAVLLGSGIYSSNIKETKLDD